MSSNHEIMNRGRLAKDLLDDELMDQIVNEMQQQLFTDWRRSSPAGRDEIHATAKALELVLQRLRALADDATILQTQSGVAL
jgi:hypothetical protein